MDGCESCQHITFQQVIEHSSQEVAVIATRVILLLTTAWIVTEKVQVLTLPDLLTTIYHLPVLDDNDKIVNVLDLTLTLWEFEAHKVHDDDCFTHG